MIIFYHSGPGYLDQLIFFQFGASKIFLFYKLSIILNLKSKNLAFPVFPGSGSKHLIV